MVEIMKITIHTESIKLDQFLKWAGLVISGGEAKNIILEGMVKVNGEVVFSRGMHIQPGDRLDIEGLEESILVEKETGQGGD